MISRKVKIVLLLFFPSIIFGQKFKLINSFQIDTFEKATLYDEGLDFVLLGNSKKGIYTNSLIANLDGTEVGSSEFQGVSPVQFSKNLRVLVKKKDKFGFVNRRGKVIIPVEYDYLGREFIEGKVLGKKDEQWFFIDTLGQTTPFPDSTNYKSLIIANPQTIISMNERREYAFLGFNGKPLLDETFYYIKQNRFHNYLFNISKKNRLSGIFSSKVGIIVPLERENIPSIKQNYIVNEHRTRSDSHYWDLDGKPIDTKKKDIVKSARAVGYIFREYREDIRYFGLCDKEFNTLFPAEFKKYFILGHGYTQLFYPNNSSIIVNEFGEVILPKDRFRVYVLSPDDLVKEKTKRVNGRTEREITWFDGQGEIILAPPIEYNIGSSPIHGKKQYGQVHTILGVKQKDTTGVAKYHLYNRQAKLLNVVDYDSIYYYTPSLLLVIKNKKQGLINEQGELVLPIEYKSISPTYNQAKDGGSFSNLLRLVTPDGKMGMADLEGNLVFLTKEPVTSIHWVNEKYLWVIKGNEYRIYEWQK